MYKFYSLSQAGYDAEVRNAKLPLQQKQIYAALVRLGKPVRGQDAVADAVAHGLITRQRFDVLAAWYFSIKRRHVVPSIKVSGDDQPAPPTGPSAPAYAE